MALLAPTKLYLPIVSELAALSNRNEYLELKLRRLSKCSSYISRGTYCVAILRYAIVGVRTSAGMVAQIGTRFGGFGRSFVAASTS